MRTANLRQFELVGTGRFELPTPRTPSECSTRLSHVPTKRKAAVSQNWGNTAERAKSDYSRNDSIAAGKITTNPLWLGLDRVITEGQLSSRERSVVSDVHIQHARKLESSGLLIVDSDAQVSGACTRGGPVITYITAQYQTFRGFRELWHDGAPELGGINQNLGNNEVFVQGRYNISTPVFIRETILAPYILQLVCAVYSRKRRGDHKERPRGEKPGDDLVDAGINLLEVGICLFVRRRGIGAVLYLYTSLRIECHGEMNPMQQLEAGLRGFRVALNCFLQREFPVGLNAGLKFTQPKIAQVVIDIARFGNNLLFIDCINALGGGEIQTSETAEK